MVAGLLILSLAANAARAADSPSSHVNAELIAERPVITPGGTVTVGLRLTMSDGWHTYWRNPGDSGMATKLKWILPDGFEAGELKWPYPSRWAAAHSVSYVYDDEVFLLSEIRAPDTVRSGQLFTLSAAAEWLECKDVCVPNKAQLSATLTVQSGKPENPGALEDLFTRTRRRMPTRLHRDWTARAVRDGAKIVLQVTPPPSEIGITGAEFFPYEDGVIANEKTQQESTDGSSVTLEMAQSRDPAAAHAKRLSGVLVLKNRSRGIELSIPIENEDKRRKPS